MILQKAGARSAAAGPGSSIESGLGGSFDLEIAQNAKKINAALSKILASALELDGGRR